jgi:hypothetical protein
MKLATFVTDKELCVPFLAPVLNLRFNAFLAALAKRLGRKNEDIIDAARDVLERAEIPQK